MTRWWWEGWTGKLGKYSFSALSLVRECGADAPLPPDNPGTKCTIGVTDVDKWIAHVEGMPR